MAQTNAYLIGDNDNCILIDAPEGVASWLAQEKASPKALLLTHQHYDHVEGTAELAATGVPVYAHSPYSRELTLEQLLEQSGMPLKVTPYQVDQLLKNQQTVDIGDWSFELAYVPGHAPDSLAFFLGDLAFSGDTLFAGSVGRPDLPGGDMDLLIQSIRDHLLSRGDQLSIHPGHGPVTSIGQERASNPYLQ